MSEFYLEGITRAQLDRIHHTSITILDEIGLRVESNAAAEIFHGAGAIIEKKGLGFEVKFPQNLVEDCIRLAPESFTLYGREPKHDHLVGPGSGCFTLFGENANVIDLYSTAHRHCRKKDLGDATLVADALDEIAIVEKCLGSQDKPAATQSLHNYEAMVTNTSKHVLHGFFSGANAEKKIAMAAACVGGRQNFLKRSCVTSTVCPTSPLTLVQHCCEVIITCARSGVGVCAIAMPLSGATAPATLAGTLAVQNAELLGCLVLSQLAAQHTPFIYGSVGAIMDLKGGIAATGAPECGVLNVGTTKMAQYYHIPSWCGSGVSDSKLPDTQAAYEFAAGTTTALLAGPNVIYGCGSIESGLTFDFAKLIMDAEQIRNLNLIKRGLEVSDESLALDTIRQVGPGGEYLTSEHTLRHMHAMSRGELFNRMSREQWVDQTDSRSIITSAYEKARWLFEHHQPTPLTKQAGQEMRAIVDEFEQELGISDE